MLHDPEGTSPGWVFGRGDCGYARGKTLTEIMVAFAQLVLLDQQSKMFHLQGITNEMLEQRIMEQRRKEKLKTKGGTPNKSDHSEYTTSSKTTGIIRKLQKKTNKKENEALKT